MDVFDEVWLSLSEEDAVDALGGMEWRRVKQEWQDAGRPRPSARWMVRRANAPLSDDPADMG